ncbi:MAG TPA: DUF4870 domain-containing protein, partial [Planctomycetota bacterium]|nr:DUF4870 domain-containing protein [Planctomycetota bacterium]
APSAEGTVSKGGTQPGVVADFTAAKAVADSVDVVEPEGPESDERLWAAAVWVAVAATLFLPPIPLFTAPMVIRRLRERASEFVSAHAENAVQFAMYATVSQAFYALIVVLAALSAQSHWRAVIFPALAVYIFVAAGVVVWLGLVGHNAWKGRRNRPVEFRKLILYR